MWVRSEDIEGVGVTVSLVWLDAAGLDSDTTGHVLAVDEVGNVTGTNDWTLLSGSFTAPADAVVVRFDLFTGAQLNELGAAWFDDAELCENVDEVCDAAAAGNPGDACSTTLAGVCVDGFLQCNFGELRCAPVVGPSLEVCDGLDNDCNGQTDEGVCPNGTPCSSGDICVSSFCAAGFCCNTSCSTGCQDCDLPGSEGTCVNVPAGQDPDDACPGADSCTGGGICCRRVGQKCGDLDGPCCSGSCVCPPGPPCSRGGFTGTCE